MERQYKTLLGVVLTTLIFLGTYLTDQNDEDFHSSIIEQERSWPQSDPLRNLQIDPSTGAASPESPESGAASNKPPIKIFYNLYISHEGDADRVLGMLREQLLYMHPPALHEVEYVNSVGHLPPGISEQYLVGHQHEGGEDGALHALWDYCRANPSHEQKVVYLHSKGSFHPKPQNDQLRHFLTEGALSQECATLPDQCNVCSSRMWPLPHPHTPGNMWLARCDYVARLRDPFDLKNETLPSVYQGKDNPFITGDHCWGYSRFFFEHWVHSHPSVHPCDLYPGMEYKVGYRRIPPKNFPKALSMAPRVGFESVGKVRCLMDGMRVNLGQQETARLFITSDYKWLYGIDIDDEGGGGLNETWYLSQFLGPPPPPPPLLSPL